MEVPTRGNPDILAYGIPFTIRCDVREGQQHLAETCGKALPIAAYPMVGMFGVVRDMRICADGVTGTFDLVDERALFCTVVSVNTDDQPATPKTFRLIDESADQAAFRAVNAGAAAWWAQTSEGVDEAFTPDRPDDRTRQ